MHDAARKEASTPAPQSGGGGALYLVAIQIASRGFTFLGNQFLLRYLSPPLLGLAVQLELLSVTILYFARESLRVALQRQPANEKGTGKISILSQQVVNLAYLAVAVGLFTSFGLGYGYLRKASDEVLESVNFWSAFQLYAGATFVELLAEPCFVIIQRHALYKVRARAETAAAMSRCVAACISVLVMHNRHSPASVLPFAIGQLCYASALITAYLTAVVPVMKAQHFSLLPRRIHQKSNTASSSEYWFDLFSKPLLALTTTFYAQSVFKLLLTQGDSLILSFLTDLKSQGAFALASNYGGLLSRLIFQPVEESSRNVFGRLLGSSVIDGRTSTNDSTSSSSSTTTTSKAGIKSPPHHNSSSNSIEPNISNATKPQKTNITPLNRAVTHLTTTLHLYTLFTLPLLSLVPPLLPHITNLILSPQWRTPTTTSLLQAYIHYIPFVAINGILDAFVTSVATPSALRTQSLLMACITGVYGAVAWVLMGTSNNAGWVRDTLHMQGFGSEGLVCANMVNMAMRILYSVWFVSAWIQGHEDGGKEVVKKVWRRSLPGISCVVGAVATGVGVRVAMDVDSKSGVEKEFLGMKGLSAQDLAYVLAGVVGLGGWILLTERQFLLDVALPLVPKRLTEKLKPYIPTQHMKQE